MLLAASYGTVSDIEILWTLIAGAGVVFGIFNLRDAWGDRKELVLANIYNGRRTIANFAVRGEAARMFVQSVFVSIGVLAMLLPDPPSTDVPLKFTIFGAIFRWGLITSAAVILGKSIDSFLVRRKLTGD
jgi:hypothetical protein